jgi:zinc transporter ZupT
MTAFNPSSTSSTRRPVGVSLLTILNAIFSGIFPIIAALGYLFLPRYDNSILDILLLLAQVVLGAMIIRFSIGTWRRNDHARSNLILCVTLYQVLLIVNTVVGGFTVGLSENILARVLSTTARCLIWISVNRWYFTKPQVVAWFKQP